MATGSYWIVRLKWQLEIFYWFTHVYFYETSHVRISRLHGGNQTPSFSHVRRLCYLLHHGASISRKGLTNIYLIIIVNLTLTIATIYFILLFTILLYRYWHLRTKSQTGNILNDTRIWKRWKVSNAIRCFTLTGKLELSVKIFHMINFIELFGLYLKNRICFL